MLPLLGPFFRDRELRRPKRRPAAPVPYGRRPAFENLEPRAMLAATLINTPTWIERGPGPITNAFSVDLDGNGTHGSEDIAVGAVQAIAVDPVNANHVFVGTANGGIWETDNVNDANPVWTTTTDQLPSLAIGAIAISPVNSNIIYAGTGSFSAASDAGGSGVGLYRSVNGGTTWVQRGFDTFNGLRIDRIIPTQLNSGDTIFVAASFGPSGNGGIYRSDDSGVTWRRLSGVVTALPNAPVDELVSFAVNATTVGFYAAVTGQGIFRSMDNGNSWLPVTNNLASFIPSTSRIDLSVSPVSGKPVYAGLIDGFGNLINVFRSTGGTDGIDNNHSGITDEPAEATWTAIATRHPIIRDSEEGAADTIHFSILADSTQNDIVYVGGTFSPGTRITATFSAATRRRASGRRSWTQARITPHRIRTCATLSFLAPTYCALMTAAFIGS
jgi:hypothetical protein